MTSVKINPETERFFYSHHIQNILKFPLSSIGKESKSCMVCDKFGFNGPVKAEFPMFLLL